MKYIAAILFAIAGLMCVANVLLDRYRKKAQTKHAKEISEQCDNVLASAARTKAIIAQARANYETIPEEYRAQFLEKYNDLENTVNNIKKDVERIRKSFGIEVTYNGTK